MRAKFSLFVLTLIVCPLSLWAQGAWQLGAFLSELTEYQRDAAFEVYLPSAEDPVTYEINLQSAAAPADTLAPADYLIRWSTVTDNGPLEGFSAYFDGNHFRFRNNRLQEYHFADDQTSFMPRGAGSQLRYGVQNNAQFADLLPQMIGRRLMEIATDTAYAYAYHADTLVSGVRRIVVDGVKRAPWGYDVQNFTYVFDKETRLPVMIDLENSPGSISEQLVTVNYKDSSSAAPAALSEEGLVEIFPDAFERFRESTFRVESLVGAWLPAFSCPIARQSERYTHHGGEPLGSATLFVVLDPAVSTTAETMEAVRQAVAMLPSAVSVVWAFKTNKEEEVEELVGALQPGETALMSPNSLIRNAGITLYPTIIICGADGQVADVITGYNKNLEEVVIQKSAILK